MTKPINELHPGYARIARTGTPVIEVHDFSITRKWWEKHWLRLGKIRGVHSTSDITGLIYFRSRSLADRFIAAMKKRGHDVVSAVGKIDNSGLSMAFVERVARGQWR